MFSYASAGAHGVFDAGDNEKFGRNKAINWPLGGKAVVGMVVADLRA